MLRRRFLKLVIGVVAMAAAGFGLFKLRDQFGRSLQKEIIKEIEYPVQGIIELSEPRKSSKVSVEQAINNRRSRRSFSQEPVLLDDISQLCWSAQGITEKTHGFRVAPSAGALYPIEIFLVVGNSDLTPGIYHYLYTDHVLESVKKGDYREELYRASVGQEWVKNAALNIVVTGIFSRTEAKYGERGRERYVFMEAGHVAENIYLQAESLALATVSVGAFYDEAIRELLSLSREYTPIYVMPIGHRS